MSNDQLQEQESTSQEETQNNDTVRQHLLCKVVDVESALLTAFQRFVEEQKSSLEDMMLLAKEELSKMELFAPRTDVDAAGEEASSSI